MYPVFRGRIFHSSMTLHTVGVSNFPNSANAAFESSLAILGPSSRKGK
jgi:hypothetical protein